MKICLAGTVEHDVTIEEETCLSLNPIRELLWDLVPISTDRYLQSLQRALRQLCLDPLFGSVCSWK